MNPAIAYLPRNDRRSLLKFEAKRRASGDWGGWEILPLPNGTGGGGWNKEIREARRNKVFSVLLRPIPNGSVHLAISSLSGIRPTFYEMQRIKNDIFGPESTAIEVYPPQSELVDDADMFHLWSVDPLPFSIFGGKK